MSENRKEPQNQRDTRVLLLSPQDNVCVACVNLKPGDTVVIDGQSSTIDADTPIGHKIARVALAAGDKVIKWGAPIGSMSEAVVRGGLVHVHNMKSDYIPTFTFEKGHRYIGEATQ